MEGQEDGQVEGQRAEGTASWVIVGTAAAIIAAVTVVHYATDMHHVAFHNVYRRLYYIPIVLSAFGLGWKGGLSAAVVASLAYVPHAFFMTHHDPAPAVDKVLEIVLYLAIGGMTGWLVERQRHVQAALSRSLRERDQLETQLVRAGRLSALGELTAGLAHEIRNPLASIMGSAEALADEFGPEHRKHRLAHLMVTEVERLDRVVRDLLQFARPSPPERRPTDVVAVASEVVQLSEHHSPPREVEVVVEAPPGRFVALADPAQLRQVALNLLLNARQAACQAGGEEGGAGGAPKVAFVAQEREVGGRRYTCLGVRDNGPGIPEEAREEIFNPYYTTRAEGTGLGLTISSRIVERHDGFIDVDSRPGETTFWVCLPGAKERNHGG